VSSGIEPSAMLVELVEGEVEFTDVDALFADNTEIAVVRLFGDEGALAISQDRRLAKTAPQQNGRPHIRLEFLPAVVFYGGAAARRVIMSDWYFDEEELRFARIDLLDLESDSAVAIANLLAAGLLEILGPCFWAGLISLFAVAEFLSH
jgi:hypothetical protein